MTTKDYIKLSLIATGYVKNISVEVNRYGINVEYNVYGETWDYKEPVKCTCWYLMEVSVPTHITVPIDLAMKSIKLDSN